jgi:predicted DCC family thiol-disulfide oxidoreductase YuxK
MRPSLAKTIIYDDNCPLCSSYTSAFVRAGVLKADKRVSFNEADTTTLCRLDMDRARHEIPLVDNVTGEVIYGLDALTTLVAEIMPLIKPAITSDVFKKFITPVYQFVSYNRRVLAGAVPEDKTSIYCAPDFSLKWRLALIGFGYGYTALCIYVFAQLMNIEPVLLLAAVSMYFLLLLCVNLLYNNTKQKQWDYLAHLAVLGFIEGTGFVVTAWAANITGMLGVMFVGQLFGRSYAAWLHAKRIENNGYSVYLNYAFIAGAILLVMFIAELKLINIPVY